MQINVGSRLQGRNAIVTGAGQGIGRAIAVRLAAEGAHVSLVGRTLSALKETAREIEDAGGQATPADMSISEEEDVYPFVDSLVAERGTVDILVNNAAIFDEPPFLESSPKAFRRILETNVIGTMIMSHAVAQHMAKARSGSIIHISSIDAFGADGPYPTYVSSKAAVSGLARAMTMELGPFGVRVNTVAPGFVNTDMFHKTSTPAVLDHVLNNFTRVPLRRLVEPEEIAAAVAFLASDDASAISGIDLVVDGGVISNLFIYETLPESPTPLGGP